MKTCSKRGRSRSRSGKRSRSRSGRRSRSKGRVSRRGRRSKNGYILFFLQMFKKSKSNDVVKIAIQAGKCWNKMSDKDKCKYIRRAKRLGSKKKRRKC